MGKATAPVELENRGEAAEPTSFPFRKQRQENRDILSTMRMTIYLLDGCSADYDINKSNFSKTPPSLALEGLHTDFLIWDFYYDYYD